MSGWLQATSLPFVVTATAIAVSLDAIQPVNAAALVAAGLLSVILFPLAALAVARGGQEPPALLVPGSDALTSLPGTKTR